MNFHEFLATFLLKTEINEILPKIVPKFLGPVHSPQQKYVKKVTHVTMAKLIDSVRFFAHSNHPAQQIPVFDTDTDFAHGWMTLALCAICFLFVYFTVTAMVAPAAAAAAPQL